MITVHASRHPFREDWVTAEVEPGQTITEICGTRHVHVLLNGTIVPPEVYDHARIKDGHRLEVWPVPQGDDTLRGVLQVVVAVVAAWVSGGASGLLASSGTWWTAAAGAGVAIGGNLLINELVPPAMAGMDRGDGPGGFNRLDALTGSRNQVAAFQPIPRAYGEFRWFPPIPMTAKPFTELEGDEQYLRMKLSLGYGPLEIGGQEIGVPGQSTGAMLTEETSFSGTPFLLGQTDLLAYDDVEFEIARAGETELYTTQVVEEQANWSTQAANDGTSAIRTTQAATTELSVEVHARLFCLDSKGRTRKSEIRWRIEYRAVGDSSWTTLDSNWRVVSTKRETVRRARRFRVPRGQYEVRLTRLETIHSADTQTQDSSTWAFLRSIIGGEQAFVVPGTIVMDLRIKATDQLQGQVDNLSVLTKSILQVYDGSAWNWEPTTNAAWVYVDVVTGAANRQPYDLGDVNEQAMLDWAAEGHEYNGVFDSDATTLSRMQEVAAAGQAAWAIEPDTRISVVRDVVQNEPRMVITPRNSWDFTHEIAAPDIPEALRVRFTSRDTWEPTERLVFDDGFDESNATRYEVLDAPGITDPDEAWKYGRYHLAALKLRPERFTFKQDVQHLRYRRGSLLLLAHDVILVGRAWGRIKSVTTDVNGDATSVITDELLPMPDLQGSYAMTIQRSDGTTVTVGVAVDAPATRTAVFDSPVSDILDGDAFAFGDSEAVTIDVKVASIQPQGEHQARITTVPAAPGIQDAISGDIPGYDPGITEPVDPEQLVLPVPQITAIESDESVLLVDQDGALQTRMLVEVQLPSYLGNTTRTQVRYRAEGEGGWRRLPAAETDAHSIVDVDEGVQYEVQARTVRGERVSAWSPLLTHTVIGKSSRPPAVTGFVADAARDRVELSWNSSPAPDIERYEIREQDFDGQAWEDATLLARPDSTDYQTGRPRSGPFLIKPIDVAGNESEDATQAVLTVVEPQVTGVTGEVIDNNVLLRWSAIQGTFDIATYEVRRGPDQDTADVVGDSDTTFTSLFETEAGQFRYWIVPIDAAGIEGQAASRVLDVDVPPDFVLRNIFNTDWQGYTADNLIPIFQVPAPARLTSRNYTALAFDGVDDYVQIGDVLDRTGTFTVEALLTPLGTGPIVSKDGGNGWALVVEADGVLRFRDAELNTANTDSSALALRQGVFQHVAAVFDAAAETTTIYVEGQQVAQVAGQTNSITANAAELRIGADDQGNFGAHRIAEVRLWGDARTQTEISDWRHRTLDGNEADLDGYWRLQEGENEVAEDFSGGGNDGNIVGASWYTPGAEAVLGAQDLSRDDLDALGYTSRDDMIAAGLNYRAQPAADAVFEEVYDAGTVVPRTGIQVTFGYQELAPGASVTTQISVRETQSDPWTDLPTGPQGFATDFRYVKIKVSLTTDGTGLLRVDGLQSRLASKQRSDAGRVEVNANPTTVPFNVDFIDVRGITTTPQGTTPLQTTVDFADNPNPTEFDVYLWDEQGNPVTGVVRWEARGF